MAISAYNSKKILSKTRAAAIFGVPKSTLLRRLDRTKARLETRANNHKLPVYKEELLIKRLLDADKRGFLIRPEFLRGIAQVLLDNRLQGTSAAALGIN
jgi:hypothetical protein